MSLLFFLFISFNTTLDTYDAAEHAIYDTVKVHSAHPLTRSYEKRYGVAKRVVNGSRKGRVPWELIASISFFESAFRDDVLARDGKGSKGYMQLHGASLMYCRKKEGRRVSMKNKADQIICGSHWIRYAMDQCKGRMDQGIAMYATGYMCDYSNSGSVTGLVRRRMKMFKRLVDNF